MKLNPNRLRRWPRRVLGVAAIVLFVLLWLNYGWRRVPLGVDTMPSTPSGALCLVQKRPRMPAVGSVVFVTLPDGAGEIVARVVSNASDGACTVKVDNPKPLIRELAGVEITVPATAVEALVLTVLSKDDA